MNLLEICRDDSGKIYVVESSGCLADPADAPALIAALQEYVDTMDPQFVEAYNNALLKEREAMRETRNPPALKKPRKTNLYLMYNRRNGYCKIGVSLKPNLREKTLQSEEPDIELIWTTPATKEDEEPCMQGSFQSVFAVNGSA